MAYAKVYSLLYCDKFLFSALLTFACDVMFLISPIVQIWLILVQAK